MEDRFVNIALTIGQSHSGRRAKFLGSSMDGIPESLIPCHKVIAKRVANPFVDRRQSDEVILQEFDEIDTLTLCKQLVPN